MRRGRGRLDRGDLGLDYSSRAGNGALGVGWGVGGLSMIHPCDAIPSALVAAPRPAPRLPPDAAPPRRDPNEPPPALGQVTGVPGSEVERIEDEFERIDARVAHAGIEARLDAKKDRAYLANAIRQAEENRQRGRS